MTAADTNKAPMTPNAPPSSEIIRKLCLKCGLCCDGSLFKDVELQAGDDADRIKKGGVRLRKARQNPSAETPGLRFAQPCRALGKDCRCAVYADRPGHCREFECLLFAEAAGGRIKLATARGIVRKARRLTAEVDGLLHRLGDSSSDKPLQQRFRKIARRIESTNATPDELAVYGELTLAFHALNHLLGSRFYREG